MVLRVSAGHFFSLGLLRKWMGLAKDVLQDVEDHRVLFLLVLQEAYVADRMFWGIGDEALTLGRR